MIYMGSKLVNSGKSSDDSLSRKTILKSLSVQEKLLLMELQKTRQNIVEELKRVEQGDGYAEEAVQGAIEDYESKIWMDTQAKGSPVGKKSLASTSTIGGGRGSLMVSSSMSSLPLVGSGGSVSSNNNFSSTGGASGGKGGRKNQNIKTGIDMLPTLETFSMRSNGGKMALRLPIFKLPAVEIKTAATDTDSINSTDRDAAVATAAFELHPRGRRVESRGPTGTISQRTLKELEQMVGKELKSLFMYLGITPDDFNILKAHFRNEVNGIDTSADAPSTFTLMCEKVRAATAMTYQHGHGHRRGSDATADVSLGLLSSGGSLAQSVSSHSTTSAAGLGMGIGAWSANVARSSSVDGALRPRNEGNGKSGKNKRNNNNNNQNNQKNSAESLRNELINSMKAMDFHSSKLKEGFVHMNGIMPVNDPKLKALRFSIAAEKMRKGLWALVRTDLQKGFEAWRLALLYISNESKSKAFARCLYIREFIQILFKIVLRMLKRKFAFWWKFTKYETRRLRRELERKSAINIQRTLRGHLGRKRAKFLSETNKYQKLYDATIRIQKTFRGKLIRWKYLKFMKMKKEDQAARNIQRLGRGYVGRKYARRVWMQKNKQYSVIKIQCMVRRRQARKRVAKLKENRRRIIAAIKIQALIRGFLVRLNIKTILLVSAQKEAAIKIQRVMRGKLARIYVNRRRAEIKAYILHRNLSANRIQALYRGFRTRVVTKIMLMEKYRIQKVKDDASTMITKTVRGFLAMRRVEKMRKERLNAWMSHARSWKEMWSDDSKAYFYLNESTGEALWEPHKEGYTKADGRLVLANGKIIDDPRFKIRHDDDEDEEENNRKSNLCSECTERIAILYCNECGDKYCTKCWKSLHAVGSRRNHSTKRLGPLDCAECEMRLAERFCVSCDEPYCDLCWRKLHARGKRRFHPFQEVSPQGYIDSKIFTMDGEEVSNYDLTFSQVKAEHNHGHDDSASSWTMYYDDSGNPYWYNETTGESTYDDPNAQAEW